ncbi:YdhK family protein [Paenisporosarcina sp. NPDC076898]|uniref:YdhK family protein n=1 Tax=unclassified Paenisporosarcina TaxID=2642018 RepID=UPI003D04495E
MKHSYKKLILVPALALTLSACSDSSPEKDNMEDMDHENMKDSSSENSMEGMDHSGSGEIPEGLAEAEKPTYEVGSTAVLQADHMEGMKGAEATIVGAFETTVYTISYTPTTGGERVENHEWVIHEEIKDAEKEPFEPGEEVTVEANHMDGMKGATAEIDSAEQTTVYMIDYTPTNGGEKVTNHKWVTDSELSAE